MVLRSSRMKYREDDHVKKTVSVLAIVVAVAAARETAVVHRSMH